MAQLFTSIRVAATVAGAGWTPTGTLVSDLGASDDQRCSYAIASKGDSANLDCTAFGFALPARATVRGIVAAIECKASAAAVIADNTIKLLSGGGVVGNNLKAVAYLGNADAVMFHGAADNLWGVALTPALVNAANFGLRAVWHNNDAGSARTVAVDRLALTAYYECPWMVTHQAESYRELTRHVFHWRSDGAGMVRVLLDGFEFPKLTGIIDRIFCVSDADAVPTTGYTLALLNEAGDDLLDGIAASVPSATPQTYWPYYPAPSPDRHLEVQVAGRTTLQITGAGADKAGTLGIWVYA